MAEDRRRPPKFSTETRKSDPRRTSDENFASFMGFSMSGFMTSTGTPAA